MRAGILWHTQQALGGSPCEAVARLRQPAARIMPGLLRWRLRACCAMLLTSLTVLAELLTFELYRAALELPARNGRVGKERIVRRTDSLNSGLPAAASRSGPGPANRPATARVARRRAAAAAGKP